MSEQSQPRKKPVKSLNRQEFYGLCEALKTNYEQLKGITNRAVLLARLEEITTKTISSRALREAQTVTGLTFKYKRPPGESLTYSTRIRALMSAVIALYDDLGKPVPEAVAAMHRHYYPDSARFATPEAWHPTEKAVLTIPVKDVPKPQTIPVANNLPRR